jgi:hypothetical protein
MPIALLLAMQAAGMIVDYFGTSRQQYYSDIGFKLQQAGIEANIYQTRLETENESLNAMRELRQRMGTQLAIFGARGTNPGAGSAFTSLTQSLSNFYSDERTRRINEMGRETELKGRGLVSSLNQSGENSKLWQGFTQRTINRFPTSWNAYSQMGKQFGLTQMS